MYMSLSQWEETHPADPSTSRGSWILPRSFTWATIILTMYWLFTTDKGLGLNTISLVGYHIFGMTVFAVMANQESVLSYASPLFGTRASRDLWYFTHLITNMIGLFSGIGGMVSILYYSDDYYSPHSWLGWCTLILWCSIVLLKKCGAMTHLHKLLGYTVYGLGLLTCVVGYQKKQMMDLVPFFANQTSVVYQPMSWSSFQSSLIVLFTTCSGIMTFIVIGRML